VTTPAEFTGALAEISTALRNAVTAASTSERPYVTLAASLDQIRAFVDSMGAAVTAEPGVAGLSCFGCVLQRIQAEQQGIPGELLPAITPAEFVVEGRSLARCHLQLQNGPVIPGRTASGIILGNGNTPPQMGGG
jgi:hypothetical protein